MLKINLIEDDSLSSVVNSFISALLPHENYDSRMYSSILDVLFRYIKLEEFQLEYRFILDSLVDLGRIRIAIPDFEPRLTKDTFEHILEANLFDVVVRNDYGIREWMQYEGINADLGIQKTREEVSQRLSGRALDLYDTCFELQEDSNALLNREPELRASFISHCAIESINLQSEIFRSKAKVGRKWYVGVQGWMEYVGVMTNELRQRLDNSDNSETIILDDLETSYSLLHKAGELFVPIADYGIPAIDEYTPILRHRLVVVVGKENIGKTKFAVDKAVNVLLSGHRVVYMCGETAPEKMLIEIMINYIWKRFEIVVRPEHLTNPDSCPDDVQKMIGISMYEVVEEGRLILRKAFTYDGLYDELKAIYERKNFDLCVIDHSRALRGTAGDGSMKAKVEKLSVDCREFKIDFPVCIMVTSHPSSAVKDTAKKDKNANDSATADSSRLSTEADELFYLRDTETLAKQDLIILENSKRRDAGLASNIILRKRFDVSAFIYEEGIQGGDTALSLKRQEGLELLDAELASAEEDVFNL